MACNLITDEGGPKTQAKYNAFIFRIRDQVAHLPQNEQDDIFREFVSRNAEYISIARHDLNALKIRLGVPVAVLNTPPLAQIAAETVVRASVWQGIAALFRAFR